jgi:hypothetical protein
MLLHPPALLTVGSHHRAALCRPTSPKGAPQCHEPPAPSSCLGHRLPKPGNGVFYAVVFLREHHCRRPASTVSRSSRRAREHRKLAPPLLGHSFTIQDPGSKPQLEFLIHLSSPTSRALHGEPLALPYPKLGLPSPRLAPRPLDSRPLAADR